MEKERVQPGLKVWCVKKNNKYQNGLVIDTILNITTARILYQYKKYNIWVLELESGKKDLAYYSQLEDIHIPKEKLIELYKK